MSMESNRVKFSFHPVDIVYMKKLALLIMISGIASAVVSGEEYTIQTISAKKEASITPVFEKKVEESALASTKKREGNCNIVTVGHYKSAQEAHHDLEKAKIIAKDAFVRPIERSTPKVCVTTVHPKEEKRVSKHTKTAVKHSKTAAKTATPHTQAVVQQGKGEHVETASGTSAVHGSLIATAGSEHKEVNGSTANEHSSEAQPSSAVAAATLAETPCKVQPCTKTAASVYLYDRNLVRKSDIGDAIEFYKNSPYHSFRPMALGR